MVPENAWQDLPAEIVEELQHILHYWATHAVDRQNGGFFGRIDQQNSVIERAPKGAVLNSRILWSFSAAYQYTHHPLHLELATRAFEYIKDFFLDPVHGGLYWTVTTTGEMLDAHKQIYAQAFGIYGMSEYFRASQNEQALALAIDWFQLIEKKSRDPEAGGYTEAFAREWTFLADMRLSARDENASKTMNTHLHIVEAYANLYEVWPDPSLRVAIGNLLQIFDEKIIHHGSYHLGLFFSTDWKMDESQISYGHDMEAGWLLQSCAESIGDNDAVNAAKKNALKITDAAMEGLDADGGLWYEFNSKTLELVAEKHWWPQAEALIGLCNAWDISGNTFYKEALLKNWYFVKNYILDHIGGEWNWGVDANNKIMAAQDKIGLWKCPYHNIRSCLEILKRSKKRSIRPTTEEY